jgi:hypothetical protein
MCYMDYFERKWLQPRGMAITRLGEDYRAQGPGRDRRSLLEYCLHYRVTPFAGSRWCTQGWKTDVINHWAAAHDNPLQLVGIAADEARRQKGRACPLVDWGIDRKGCVKIIQDAGLDVPRKSGCWICPFQKISQWHELFQRYPRLYALVEEIEAEASERRGIQAYLLAGGEMTLAQLRLRFESQGAMFDDDEMDRLMIYKPCVCGL